MQAQVLTLHADHLVGHTLGRANYGEGRGLKDLKRDPHGCKISTLIDYLNSLIHGLGFNCFRNNHFLNVKFGLVSIHGL